MAVAKGRYTGTSPSNDYTVLGQFPPVWKGKEKIKRDWGNGGSDGVVLSLTLVGDGIFSAVYTVPITVGKNNQQVMVQVDTGSSDLWIASNGCSTQACTSGKPKLYDPTASSSPTGQNFNIQYLSGAASGPIVWDRVVLGGYEIDNQALAAVTSVTNETLGPQYSGILGLALPLDSVIAQTITPVTTNAPDGATLVSNLFGSTPTSEAPSQYFYSLLIGRPGSSKIPTVLGIGAHPSSEQGVIPSDGPTIKPENVAYSSVQSEDNGVHYWKTELRALTIYINGTKYPIKLGQGVGGGIYPNAILDSGVPYIIATPAIANAVWGALNINPAADGNYYVPCTTPLNMTVTLDERAEIPIHPLDVTAVSSDDPSGNTCIGLIQQNVALTNPETAADIVLGASFLRNVYTVMAYEPANVQGIVGNGAKVRARSKRKKMLQRALIDRDDIEPRLGLLNLTDPTTAMAEFNTVRVMKQPLDSKNPSSSASSDGGHKFPVGVAVLIGLIGFIVFCAALFGARWFAVRRRLRNNDGNGGEGRGLMGWRIGRNHEKDKKEDIYNLTDFHGLPPSRSHSHVPSEDTQKTLQDMSYDTAHTRVDKRVAKEEWEVGYRYSRKTEDSDSAEAEEERGRPTTWMEAYAADQPPLHGEWRPPMHERTLSGLSARSNRSERSMHYPSHSPPTSSIPLIMNSAEEERYHRTRSTISEVGLGPGMGIDFNADELGLLSTVGMAGVGTARRGSVIDEHLTTDMMRNPRGKTASIGTNSVMNSRHDRRRSDRLSSGSRVEIAPSDGQGPTDLL